MLTPVVLGINCRALRVLAVIAAIATYGYTSDAFAQAGQVGVAIEANTRVEGRGPGGNRVIEARSPIFSDDRLSANRTGNAQIILADNTKVVVGPNAVVDVDNFVFSSNKSFSSLTLKAAKGTMRFISGNSPSKAYKINTPTGTIGVRGTSFDLTINGKETEVVVVKGAVDMCPANGQCRRLQGRCAYGVMDRRAVDIKGALSTQSEQDKARFPLIINQRPLRTNFRHFGPNCASRFAFLPNAPADRSRSPSTRSEQTRSAAGRAPNPPSVNPPAATPPDISISATSSGASASISVGNSTTGGFGISVSAGPNGASASVNGK